MQRKLLSIVSIVLGVVFLALAAVYWSVPASSLPHAFPGYLADSPKIHFKHGLGAFLLGIGAFVYAWFAGGPSSK